MAFQFDLNAQPSNEGLLDTIRLMFSNIKSKVKWMSSHLQSFKTLNESKVVNIIPSKDLYPIIDSCKKLTSLLIKISNSTKPLDLRKEMTENMGLAGLSSPTGAYMKCHLLETLKSRCVKQSIKDHGYTKTLRSTQFPNQGIWYANDFIATFSQVDDLSVLKAAVKGIKKVVLKPEEADTKQVRDQLQTVWECRRVLMNVWFDQLKAMI